MRLPDANQGHDVTSTAKAADLSDAAVSDIVKLPDVTLHFNKPQASFETPTLETKRLYLRPLVPSDAKAMFENWASDAECVRYMSWDVHDSLETTIAYLQNKLTQNARPELYDFGILLKETGAPIGSVGITYRSDYDVFELGYIISRKHWILGYTTEAARRVLDFGIDELGIYKYYSFHAVDNVASGNVLRKLGFVPTGERFYASPNGTKSFMGKSYSLSV